MNNYYEQFLTKNYGVEQQKYDSYGKMLLICSAISFLTIGIFAGVALLVGYFTLLLMSNNKFIEYEYELVDDRLAISKIISKRKRKLIGMVDMNKIVDVDNLDKCKEKGYRITKACLDESGLNEKVIVVKDNSKVKAFHIAMDNNLLKICSRVSPMNFNNI